MSFYVPNEDFSECIMTHVSKGKGYASKQMCERDCTNKYETPCDTNQTRLCWVCQQQQQNPHEFPLKNVAAL